MTTTKVSGTLYHAIPVHQTKVATSEILTDMSTGIISNIEIASLKKGGVTIEYLEQLIDQLKTYKSNFK